LHGAGTTIGNALNVSGSAFTNLLSQQHSSSPSSTPKAYLNILFFDEQFKFVQEGSEVVPISTSSGSSQLLRITANAKTATKNGYVPVVDETQNFTNQWLFNALDGNVRSMAQYRERIIQQNLGNQTLQLRNLFAQYNIP
jgi:hypothetical protein